MLLFIVNFVLLFMKRQKFSRALTAAGITAAAALMSGCGCEQPDRTEEYSRQAVWMDRNAEKLEKTQVPGKFGGSLDIYFPVGFQVNSKFITEVLHWVQGGAAKAVSGEFQNLDLSILDEYRQVYNPQLESGSQLIFNNTSSLGVIQEKHAGGAIEATLPRDPEGEVTEIWVHGDPTQLEILDALLYGLTHHQAEPLAISDSCLDGGGYPGRLGTESLGGAFTGVLQYYLDNYTTETILDYENYVIWTSQMRIDLPDGTALKLPAVDEETFNQFKPLYLGLISTSDLIISYPSAN